MKRTILGIAALGAILVLGWAEASQRQGGPGAPAFPGRMMAGAMMSPSGGNASGSAAMPGVTPGVMTGGMMTDPLFKTAMTLFALPEMKTELGLSDQQVVNLKKVKGDGLSRAKDLSAKLATKQKELSELLSGETSRNGTVRTLLNDIASLRAQRQYLGFDTAFRMKAMLTADQRARFVAMKPMELHQVIMSRVAMPERMLMAQFTSSDSMMREDMMGSGMMHEMMGGGAAPAKEAPAERK